MKFCLSQILCLTNLALVTMAGTVQAAPTFITTAQGNGADASVRGGGFAGDNFGKLDILRLRSAADLGSSRKIYLRFDLSTLPEAANKATDVTLGLRLAAPEGHSPADKVWTLNVWGIKDGSEGETWDEGTISWKTAPANVPDSPNRLMGDVQFLGTTAVLGDGTAGQTISFTDPQFKAFLRADTNKSITLVITRQEPGEGPENDVTQILSSKESATNAPPVLSVAFQGEEANLPSPAEWAKLPKGQPPLPFESEIEAFEAADLVNPPKPGGIVFVGSSSIRKWTTLAQDFPTLNVINRGFGGSQISDSVHFAQRIVTPYQPRLIVFYAGTNDIAAGKSAETVFEDYKAFVAQVREKLPTTPIAYISNSPTPARWSKIEEIKKLNSLISAYCKAEPNLQYIDIYPLMLDANGQPRPELFVGDKLHMNPDGYAIWVKAVAPYLAVH